MMMADQKSDLEEARDSVTTPDRENRAKKYEEIHRKTDSKTDRKTDRKTDKKADRKTGSKPAENPSGISRFFSALFFPCAIIYHELLLRFFDADSIFFSALPLLRIALFALAAGLLLFLILDMIPAKRLSRFLGGFFSAVYLIVLCVERGMKAKFGMYYGVLAAADTAENALTGFGGDVLSTAVNLIPFILLALIPFVLYLFLRRKILRERGMRWPARVLMAVLIIAAQLSGAVFCRTEKTGPVYSYDYSMTLGIPEFGLTNSIRLELQYALFGMPMPDLESFLVTPPDETDPEGREAPGAPADPGSAGSSAGEASGSSTNEKSGSSAGETTGPSIGEAAGSSTGETTGSSTGETTESSDKTHGQPSDETAGETTESSSGESAGESSSAETAQSVEYGFNVLDSIDFAALADTAADDTERQMHQYFGSLTPSRKNEYTGMFSGKNLILICAESFDDYAVDPDLTPTLYRLTQQEGFVFTNFYQPDWSLSTCGGEFSEITGLIPHWIGRSDSARTAIDNAMPTTPGNLFRDAWYQVLAWHNGNYDYYNRDQYLSAFGYDYKGCSGGGLELPTEGWPASDKEMIEATADEYITRYVQVGQPFHAYYMTVTAHGPWSFDNNKWSAQYRDQVEEKYPELSEPCKAYLASNIELDRALEVLVKKLEDAGIANDTLIVMCADHYPYFLSVGNNQANDSTDYYNELNRCFGRPEDSEKTTSRYRSTLMMWSASIPRTVVDTPCYSCDIVPTILNLFGLEYDSRLYTGRDIFDTDYETDKYSDSMPLVIFGNNHGQGDSWITAAGVYEAVTGKFTPNPGVTVPEDYVEKVAKLVKAKLQYSKLIVTEDYYRKVFRESDE